MTSLTNINETLLNKLVSGTLDDIVILREKDMIFCDRRCLVVVDYTLHRFMQKLYCKGILTGYKDIKSNTRVADFRDIMDIKNLVDAENTNFIKYDPLNKNEQRCCFKIGDKFVLYDKKYIDVFENCTYKAQEAEVPLLKVFNSFDELIGVVLPLRVTEEEQERQSTIIKALEEGNSHD